MSSQVWDLPIERNLEGTVEDCIKYATKTAKRFTGKNIQPRLILQYSEECSCGICNNILLFILPLKAESDIRLEGKFFKFEDMENDQHQLNKSIKKELEHLKDAASLWKEFYL